MTGVIDRLPLPPWGYKLKTSPAEIIRRGAAKLNPNVPHEAWCSKFCSDNLTKLSYLDDYLAKLDEQAKTKIYRIYGQIEYYLDEGHKLKLVLNNKGFAAYSKELNDTPSPKAPAPKTETKSDFDEFNIPF